MADVNQYIFTPQAVAEALVKMQGLREGIWGLYVEFGVVSTTAGPSRDQQVPAAVVPVVKLGLQRMPAENSLAVDAARVNPLAH
jgi:hypothetical protein